MLEHWPQGLQIGFPNSLVFFFFKALGANIRPWSSAFIRNLGQIEKTFYTSIFTPTVKPLGLISTFEPIEMLDLSWTLAFDSLCKVGLSAKELLFLPTHPKPLQKPKLDKKK